ncbi:MFS transporter [Halopolyspora algeriensis]|uniref:MFS transporter n=1 Tax=Halopolyspora algeriensis TaxID=1500506 RepID=A0A368VXL3_9ACTN|nr:MFS transporter [Halopolyspora algeriensis]RCW46047.1 MFS transporter [Halopolyspora algeriensis]
MPLYPLYALLFADTGLSTAEISALFAVWSAVALLAEVPSGILADRFSRRSALVAAGILQALGYALWTVLPGFPAFAAGFVLWGIGGSLVSGALEALLYEGLAAAGAETHYARLLGHVQAAGLLAQLPAAASAAALFSLGGYVLVGWVSVGCCLTAAALACRLPEPPRAATPPTGYRAMLRAGFTESAARPTVRYAVLAVAVLTGLDAFEEYTPLLAQAWGWATGLIPLAALSVPMAAAAGAALSGPAHRLHPRALAGILGVAVLVLVLSGLLQHPAGLVGLAAFHGLHQLVLVVTEARLQHHIEGSARATVTSAAGLGGEIAALALYATWALGGLMPVAVLAAMIAVALPFWLRTPEPAPHPDSLPSPH